jgi:hypothetical protein
MVKTQTRNTGTREIPVKEVTEFSLIDETLRQRIADKAHELYRCRGCCHGRDLDDWLEAEQFILGELRSQAESKAKRSRSEGQRSK